MAQKDIPVQVVDTFCPCEDYTWFWVVLKTSTRMHRYTESKCRTQLQTVLHPPEAPTDFLQFVKPTIKVDNRVFFAVKETPVTHTTLDKIRKVDSIETLHVGVFFSETVADLTDILHLPGALKPWHNLIPAITAWRKLYPHTTQPAPAINLPTFRITVKSKESGEAGHQLAQGVCSGIVRELHWQPDLQNFLLEVVLQPMAKGKNNTGWLVGACLKQAEKIKAAQKQQQDAADRQERLQEILAMNDNSEEHFLAAVKALQWCSIRQPKGRGGGGEQWNRANVIQRSSQITLESCAVTFTLIDHSPQKRLDPTMAEKLFEFPFAWEFLPRGLCEIRDSRDDQLLRLAFGIRKFGHEEEHFGPLAQQAPNGAYSALQLMPQHEKENTQLMFLTKENGEMCLVSFCTVDTRKDDDGSKHLLCIIGSKNVRMLLSLQSEELFMVDMGNSEYDTQRYVYAKEICATFQHVYWHKMTQAQRTSMIHWMLNHKGTMLGESIHSNHQHITDYRCCDTSNTSDTNATSAGHPNYNQIRFFCITSHQKTHTHGITTVDPSTAKSLFQGWGLQTVNDLDVVDLCDSEKVTQVERRHRTIPNSEGAVVYVVTSDPQTNISKTVLMYKYKNEWYILVRAIREKIASHSSFADIRRRVKQLHIHHPDEYCILLDYLGYYTWLQRHISTIQWPSIRDRFVSLKAQFDKSDEKEAIMQQIRQKEEQRTANLQNVAQQHQLQIITRGIQGSGKTSMCIALCSIVGGTWINQDEELALLKRALTTDASMSGTTDSTKGLNALARKRFLNKISGYSSDDDVKYLFIDKMNIKEKHITDILQHNDGNGKPFHILLLQFGVPTTTDHHPKGGSHHHPDIDNNANAVNLDNNTSLLDLCTERIKERGAGHRTLFPAAAERATAEAYQAMDTLSQKCLSHFDKIIQIDIRKSMQDNAADILSTLHGCGYLKDHHLDDLLSAIPDGMQALVDHEKQLIDENRCYYWALNVPHNVFNTLYELISTLIPTKSTPLQLKHANGTTETTVQLKLKTVDHSDISHAGDDPTEENCGVVESDDQIVVFSDDDEEEVPDGQPEGEQTHKIINMKPIVSPHITLLYTLKANQWTEEEKGIEKRLVELEGKEEISVEICKASYSARVVACHVNIKYPHRVCANDYAHITMAKVTSAAAVETNELLAEVANSSESVRTIEFPEPVCFTAKVQKMFIC